MKTIPTISKDSATIAWVSYNSGDDFDETTIEIEFIGDEEMNQFTDIDLEQLKIELTSIQRKFGESVSNRTGGEIDSIIVEPVHKNLVDVASVSNLSNIGFWRWLSNVSCDGFFWKFIMWRYNSLQQINWGITEPSSLIEVYFYRAWLRGHKMIDTSLEDPYWYAKKGSSDIWRSHILRQEFGKDREFVKALLDTIYNENNEVTIGTDELRTKLIPAIRVWTSNATFSHLTYDECKQLLATLRTHEV